MTACAHRLWNDPAALVCTRDDDGHTTHVYASSWAPDLPRDEEAGE